MRDKIADFQNQEDKLFERKMKRYTLWYQKATYTNFFKKNSEQ